MVDRQGGKRLELIAFATIGVLLASLYTVGYVRDPAFPGSNPEQLAGWWGWFDQSMALRSTAALVHGNLDPSQHHYPLGYSLLGVPSYLVLPKHPFFIVDLASLLGAFVGFVALSRRLGLPTIVAAALFVFGVAGDRLLLRQWVVPWNTTPVGACTWLLLAAVASWIDGVRRPVWIGLLMGVTVVCRPSDAVLLVPCVAALIWADRAVWRSRVGATLRMGAATAAVVLPVVALHLAIYGFAQSPYMLSSARIGFTLFDFGWKSYVLFVDPTPWFADGEGILQRSPWVALGLAGAVAALLRGQKDRVVVAVLAVHAVLYIAYVDLLPFGLWRFLNIHYFAWAYPGYALLAALLVRDLARLRANRMRWVGLGSIAVTLVVLCLRVGLVPVTTERPAKALDFAGPLPPYLDTLFIARLELKDARGEMMNVSDFRTILYPGGVRVIGLRRDFSGPVAWVPGHAPAGFEGTAPAMRWGASLRAKWPPVWFSRAPPPAIPIPLN